MSERPAPDATDGERSHAELEREVQELRARLLRLSRAEEASGNESREPRLRILLENSPDVIMVLDLEAYVLYMNRVVAPYKLEHVLGLSALSFMPPSEHERYMMAFRAVVAKSETQRIEVTTREGDYVYSWETRLVPLREGSRTFAVMAIATDVTQRRNAERALLESEEKLRLAVSATGVGLWKWDAQTGEVTWDAAMARLLDRSAEDLPRTLLDYEALVHPEDRATVAEAFAQLRVHAGACDELEHRVITPDGSVHTLLWKGSEQRRPDGSIAAVVGGAFDLTERKRLEEQLRHAQKMEALGQLTAGIAHNFNNMLTVILSNLQLGMTTASDSLRPRLKDADHAARRAADMVRELMVFARRHPSASRREIDVREVARRTVEICRTTFDKNIELTLDLSARTHHVLADAGQLEQVLLNICLNARDAIEAQGNPRPRIDLRVNTVAGGTCVTIEDNGPGMSEDVRRRIFEPFFTTKEVGRGTGLGLATAYGIVTDHGGTIECESSPGAGAKFRVWLPCVDPQRASEAPGGHETLLLVEDEELVRNTTMAVLASGGYEVRAAANGEEAITIFERDAEQIKLVVLDWTMPRIPGERVLAALVRRAPDVRVVLFSGHAPPDRLPVNVRGVIQKPAPVETLLATVRSALDA